MFCGKYAILAQNNYWEPRLMQTQIEAIQKRLSALKNKTSADPIALEVQEGLINPSDRFHGLDFLRSFALLMGVLLHSVSMYLEPSDGSDPRPVAAIIFVWIHTWRMPLFMLLAGFFTALSLTNRTNSEFFVNRIIRLGTPLLLLWLIIPHVDESTVPMFQLPDMIAYFLTDKPPSFRLDHLWFLYYLLILYFIALIAGTFFQSVISYVEGFRCRRVSLLIFWLPLLWLLSTHHKPTGAIFSDVPSNLGELKIGSFLFLSAFFVIGVQLHQNRSLIDGFKSKWFYLPSFVVCSIIPVGVMGWGVMKDEPFTFVSPTEMWLTHLIMTMSTIFLVAAFIGFAEKNLTANGRMVNWLVRRSYPIYVFHLIFVYGVGGYLIRSGWDAVAVVTVSMISGILGPTIIYASVIKHTPLDWVFNGYKHSKFKLKNNPRFSKYL